MIEKNNTKIDGVFVFKPEIFKDERGSFLETYNSKKYNKFLKNINFLQDNLSFSSKNVLRGLHIQKNFPQGKLVRVVHGEVFDVILDLRKNSKTFGKWESFIINDSKMEQIWIPSGIAHGFQVLSDTAIFEYKCDEYYMPEDEQTILWKDEDLKINWPLKNPIVSDKDNAGIFFKDFK